MWAKERVWFGKFCECGGRGEGRMGWSEGMGGGGGRVGGEGVGVRGRSGMLEKTFGWLAAL